MKVQLKYRLLLAAVFMQFVLISGVAAQNVRWNSDGTKTLTQDGWTLAPRYNDDPSYSVDFSNGQADAGTDGVWHINDNSSTAYMRMYKDPGVQASQGLVMARVKFIAASTNLIAGTFGYSSAIGGHSVVLCIRPGQMNWKTAEGGNMSPEPVSVDTSGYRVYALRWYSGGTFDAWYSNTTTWSSNQSDWTQVASGGSMQAGNTMYPLTDRSGATRSGLLLGHFSSSNITWEGSVDYIAWSNNSNEQLPWTFDPSPPVPDNAMYVSDTLPGLMQPSQQATVSVTFKNTGTNTWTSAAGYQLGAVGDSDPFCAFNRVVLAGGDSIATNQQKTFIFQMTAPSTTGTYTTDWRMVNGGAWFGDTKTGTILVTMPDNSQFISDTIPTTMIAGQQYNVSVTMKNLSQNTWTQAGAYKLGMLGSDPFYPVGRVELSPSDSIGPNQQKTFSYTMTAPGVSGIYTTNIMMVRELITWFGDTDSKTITVSAPAGEVGVLLNDPLQGATSGTRYNDNGSVGTAGQFVAGGWTPTDGYDGIYWHLPRSVSHGRAEFYIKGINPDEKRTTPWVMNGASELFHMYDYTWNNSDTSYLPGYRDNPFKMFLRHCGDGYSYNAKIDAMKVVWGDHGDVIEDYTSVLSWNPATNYHFTIEWGPDGNGDTCVTCYRDGVQFYKVCVIGVYEPIGHAVRIGASSRMGDEGVPQGAIFSYLKITDLSETVVPPAPAVMQPGNTLTTTSRTPLIRWHGDPHTFYQVRICTSNDPNVGIAWDSGQVSSIASQVTSGTLNDQTVYYAFAKLGTATGWSSWSPAGYWFKVDTSYVPARRGRTVLNGSCFQDDGGKFLALGFSHMRALNRCKYDRDRYINDLCDMASKGFNYQRILSMVSWTGMEIVPIDNAAMNLWHWYDYDQQLKDAIDIAYDNYGIRTEIAIFADAQNCMPNGSDRYAHLDRIISDLSGREQKILGLEIANEYWQNGLTRDEVRTYGCYLAARTTIPVALSSPTDDGDMCAMYGSSCADYATYHASRDTGNYGWTPVSDVWRMPICAGLPPVSSDEPIGPGSSVAEENDPMRLCSAAAVAWIAQIPAYTYHGRFGTNGLDKNTGLDVRMSNTPGFGAYQYLMKLLPSDLPCWTRNDGKESAAPFTAYCKNTANTYWTDTTGATDGCYMNVGAQTGASDGDQFICYPIGIFSGGVKLEARRQIWFKVYNPLTGALVMDLTTKTAGQSITLAGSSPANIAYLIKGGFGNSPGVITCPGAFTASPDGTTNHLQWTNPPDLIFSGMVIRYRTDTYPSSPTDGASVCYKTGSPGASDSFDHAGVNPGLTYYYGAWGYDGISLYSACPALATTAILPEWINETFPGTYTNGNLGGQGYWATVGTSSAQVQSTYANGGTGKAALLDTIATGQTIANQLWFRDKTSGNVDISFNVAQDAAGTTNQLIGYINIYGSTPGATEITKILVQKGTIMAEHSTGTVLLTSATNLAWYNLKISFNVASRTMQYFVNGSTKGTYTWKGTATTLSKVILTSDRNANLNPQKIYIDDVKIEPTPGQVATVSDDGAWSPSLSKLHFTFTPVAGTPEYQYAIGTSSGGTQIRSWTSCGTSTDVLATGLSLAENTYYYVSVQCLSMFGTGGTSKVSNGIKVGVGVATINSAKAMADGSSSAVKALRGKVVSVPFPGYFYVQEPDSPFGLKVVSTAPVNTGDQVDVCGMMKGSGAERYMDGTGDGVIKTTPGPGGPYPVVLRNAAVGGVTLNSNTPGVIGGIGPNNVGLYVSVCGSVTQIQAASPMYFYVDDGSGMADGTTTNGTPNVGLRIAGDPAGIAEGSYVSVKGVVSCFSSSGLRPQVLPSQVVELAAP